jgi:protein XagA
MLHTGDNPMKKWIVACLLLAVCIVFPNTKTLYAGAWTQEKGKSYHRLAANYYFADRDFSANGNSRSMPDNGDFRDFNLSYYMEYGVIDELTVLSSIYYKDIKREDDFFRSDAKGMGDVDLGVRCRLYSSDIEVFAVQGLIKVPEFYDEDDALPLGNGQYDYEMRLLFGRSLWPMIPGYMNLEAAYRYRAKQPRDEFRYLVEVGSNLGANFYARAKLDAIVGLGNGDDVTDDFGNPTSTLEYDLAKLDLVLGYQVTRKWGLELGYTPALWGENTAKGATWTIAVAYQPRR